MSGKSIKTPSTTNKAAPATRLEPAGFVWYRGAWRLKFAGGDMIRNFDSLSEREIPALAISLEEEDERVYADYAEGLRENFSASAAVFDGMRVEESSHRRRLIELYKTKCGDHIPLIRRQDVKGFVSRRPVWLVKPLGLETVRNQASAMEVESRRFYEKAAGRAQDPGVRQLLDDLAQE